MSEGKAVDAAGRAALLRAYRRLRYCGEGPDFLRHAASVYAPDTCAAAASTLLKRHAALRRLAAERAEASILRLDVRARCAVASSRLRLANRITRSRLQLGAVISDALVLVIMVLLAYTVLQSLSVLHIAIKRMELLEQMVAPILESVQLLENSGQMAGQQHHAEQGKATQ